MDSKQFAANLRQLRQEKGCTQEQLAQELGVSPQSVSRWECGTTLPDVMLLPALARFYHVTVDDLYHKPTTAYPNYAQRLLAVYEASQRSEDFLLAEQEFTRLLSGPHTADDLRCMGVLYHYMTKYSTARAREFLQEAIRQADPADWVYSSACQQKIALMCDLGRGNEEAAHYAQALESNSADPMAWLLCVAAHHYAGQSQRAYDYVCQATERFPEYPALHVHAGDICRALKRYEEAFRYWQKAHELDDGCFDAIYSMGFCYEELGMYRKALEIWEALHKKLLQAGFTQECQLPQTHLRKCREQL